jgi:hypothetical protein
VTDLPRLQRVTSLRRVRDRTKGSLAARSACLQCYQLATEVRIALAVS